MAFAVDSHHKRRVVIWLYEPLCTERISIAVLYVKASCKLPLILFYNVIIRKLNRIIYDIPVLCLEHGTIYKRISFTSIPLASASAISMMLLSPMPYEMISDRNLKELSA